jgi:hypothetical protein
MDKEISELNSSILEDIKQMFDEYNSYAKLYRMVRDKLETKDMSNMKLRIIGKIGCDGRRHIFVQHLMLRLLIVGDFDVADFNKDIIIEQKTSILKHVSILNTAYLTLQFIV